MGNVENHLQTIAQARIFFGHRSVGRNVLAGLAALAEEVGVPLRIVEVTGTPPDDAPGVFHANIGQNGDPASKCETFERLVIEGSPQYDIVAMKFCYADLRTTTPLSVQGLLERYREAVNRVRTARRDVSIMHMTIPLKTRPRGVKAALKRVLGIPVAGDADNILREAFNQALRNEYAGESLFDLAAVESTRGDGSRSGFTVDGGFVPTLDDAYTYDGGHLTGPAQKIVAAEFAEALVDALAARAGRTSQSAEYAGGASAAAQAGHAEPAR